MRTRPVGQIGDRPDVSWPTFTRRPYPHHSNACLRRLTQSLGHAQTFLIAVHHRDIGADKTKGPSSDHKATAASLHERVCARFVRRITPLTRYKKGRAHKCERGNQEKSFYHSRRKLYPAATAGAQNR